MDGRGLGGDAVVFELLQERGLSRVVETQEQDLPALVSKTCAAIHQTTTRLGLAGGAGGKTTVCVTRWTRK